MTFYAIGGSLLDYLRQVVSSVTTVFMPLASSFEARGEQDQLRRLLIQGTRGSIVIASPIAVALFFRGHTFIQLWMGGQYEHISGRVLQILLLAQVFSIANFTAGAGITITDLGNGELEWASTSVLNVEVGGTPITSTNPINFVAGTGIAITNPSAGEILISASGSGSPAGSNVVTMPILNPTTVSAGLNGFTLVFKIPATYIVGVGPSVQVGLLTTATLPFIVNAASIGATLPGSSVWTTSPVPLTWPGGSFSSAGTLYLSNPAAITIDTAHDYYIAVYIDPSSSAGNAYFTTSNAGGNVWQAYGGITGFLSGNHSSDASATSLMSPIGSDIFSIAQIIIG